MRNWIEDLLSEITHLKNEKAIFEKIEAAAKRLGFEYCLYGMRAPLPFNNPQVFMMSNYPTAWRDRYSEAGYMAIDPTVSHCKRKQTPVVWSDKVFETTPQLWHEAQDHGLRYGWAQSSLEGRGSGGMLSLARTAEPLTLEELSVNELKLHWLVNISHIALSKVLSPKLHIIHSPSLTPRETEVLKWHADGKTLVEISEILFISVDTVKFHTKNVIYKLGVANKTAAVAKAAVLGYLD